MRRARRPILAGATPLTPQRKWRAITLATLLFVPAYWCIVSALVSFGSEDPAGAPTAGPLIAFGLSLVPFVFLALAVLSDHPRASGATVKAMLLAIAVGVPVSAFAADGVTGLIAGVGAGGIAALRADADEGWRPRAIAVTIATVYIAFLLRTTSEVALLVAPALPFTGIGVADHLAERLRERQHEGR